MKNKKIALAVISGFAMTFTFSCGNGCYTADSTSGPCSYEMETVAEISSSSSAPACGSWVEIISATCDRKGVQTRICASDPSNIEMREIPQLSDCSNVSSSSSNSSSSSFARTCDVWGGWVGIKTSCVEKGVEMNFCMSDPSISPKMRETEPLEWGEWNITTAASGGNPAKGERYCFNGNVKIGEEKSEHLLICGSKPYDEDLEFCQNGIEVKTLCDGKTYNSTQFCQADTYEIKDLCVGTNSNTNTYTAYTENQFCDSRDGRVYKWVKIGGQVWMAENLKYVATDNSSRCGDGSGNLTTANTSTCDTYGRLYNWSTAMAVCPSGWHLPTDGEWAILTDAVGSNAGTKLKANSDSWKNNGKGTDNYGFSALPGGYGNSTGSGNFGFYGYWWTASPHTTNNISYCRLMSSGSTDVTKSNDVRTTLFSVRCVKNN